MKYRYLATLCCAILLQCNALFSQSQRSHIDLVYPQGSEVLKANSLVTIRWTGTRAQDTIRLEYSTDAGQRWNLLTDKATGNSFQWAVPALDGSSCRIRARRVQAFGSMILSGHIQRVFQSAWNSDGTMIATVSNDSTARIWDGLDGSLLHVLRGHSGPVNFVVWSPDDTKLLTVSDDHTAIMWNAVTGSKIHTLEGHGRRVVHADWSPDGNYVVTGSDDATARLYNVEFGGYLRDFFGSSDVTRVHWSKDGKSILTASKNGRIRIWDPKNGLDIDRKTISRNIINDARWSRDGKRILAATNDITPYIVYMDEQERPLKGHNAGVLTAAWSPDEKKIVSASYDSSARIWDAASGKLLHTLAGHKHFVWDAEWSPDGEKIATASFDANVKLWNAADGKLDTTFTGHGDTVFHAAWSPDGSRLATSSVDNTTRIWGLREYALADGDSSGLFSIRMPEISLIPVSMGVVQLKRKKDSTMQNLIVAKNSSPVKIQSLKVTGANSGDFSLTTATMPFPVSNGKPVPITVRFRPGAEGLRSAVIEAVTDEQDTLRQEISGTGIEAELQSRIATLDFGQVLVGESRDTTIVISFTNTGIDSVKVSALDIAPNTGGNFSIIGSPAGTVIAPQEHLSLSLRFSAGSEIPYISRLRCYYEGNPVPADFLLTGEGIREKEQPVADTPLVRIWMPDTTLVIGEEEYLPVYAQLLKGDLAGTVTLSFTVSLDKNLLLLKGISNGNIVSRAPEGTDRERLTFEVPNVTITSGVTAISALQLMPLTAEYKENEVRVDTLGGRPGPIRFKTGNAKVRSGGVCFSQPVRLFTPEELSVHEITASDELEITTVIHSAGEYSLQLCDVNGQCTEITSWRKLQEEDERLIFYTGEVQPGAYLLILSAPTTYLSKKIMIMP